MKTQNKIQYWNWKSGNSILTTEQLKGALEYAKEYKKYDLKWLKKEIAKRNVFSEIHFEGYKQEVEK